MAYSALSSVIYLCLSLPHAIRHRHQTEILENIIIRVICSRCLSLRLFHVSIYIVKISFFPPFSDFHREIQFVMIKIWYFYLIFFEILSLYS